MNKQDREIYSVLSGEVNSSLCMFCKYNHAEGISPCDMGEPSCNHPLKYRLPDDYSDFIKDCWGFRLLIKDISICADLTGIILQNSWDEWVYWKNEKGTWKIWGEQTSLPAFKLEG